MVTRFYYNITSITAMHKNVFFFKSVSVDCLRSIQIVLFKSLDTGVWVLNYY